MFVNRVFLDFLNGFEFYLVFVVYLVKDYKIMIYGVGSKLDVDF